MDDRPQLSTHAIRLLAALRQTDATRASRAVTDRRLAVLMDAHPRVVIDAAAELLAAGYLVLAGGRGRWIGSLAEARHYERALRGRGLRVLRRRKLLRAAIRRNELRQARDDRGQLTLLDPQNSRRP